MLLDEVQCGLGRTGELCGWRSIIPGDEIVPDSVSWAKSIGSGYPLGSFWIRDRVLGDGLETKLCDLLGPGTHGTTYGGNPLACAVGEAVMDVVNTPEVLAGVKAKAARFKTKLAHIGQQYGVFSEVRGLGLLIGCVLSDAWKGKAKAVLDAAALEGVMVLQASPVVVRFAPSLVVEDADLDEGLARFKRAVAKLTQA